MSDACHWNGHQRVTARHDRECVTSGCAGCEPCRESHCACGRHLRESEPLTCSVCVGRTRTDLQRIDDLCSLVSVAATEGRVTSELMALGGPVAERTAFMARRSEALSGAFCSCDRCPDERPMPLGPLCAGARDQRKACTHHACRRLTFRPTCPGLVDWLDSADDDRHPLWVLGAWDILITEHLAHDRPHRVTVPSAVNYLTLNLTYLAQDATFAFDELAREIRDCREHVEQVMGVAPWSLKGAPCPTCRVEGAQDNPPLTRHFADGPDDSRDQWCCRRCGEVLELDEYEAYVYRDWLARAKHLTAAQILAQYRVPEAKIRSWAAPTRVSRDGAMSEGPPKLKCVGRDEAGRKLYSVKDVLNLRGSA